LWLDGASVAACTSASACARQGVVGSMRAPG
jgi:hypothetical protein